MSLPCNNLGIVRFAFISLEAAPPERLNMGRIETDLNDNGRTFRGKLKEMKNKITNNKALI